MLLNFSSICATTCIAWLLFSLPSYCLKIIIPKNAVETYDALNHDRDEYNNMAFKFMEQAGIKLVKKLEI